MFSLFNVKAEDHSQWSDRQLFKALNEGNEQAFHVIVQRFHFVMYESAWHIIRSKSASEDIVQAVFVKVWQEPARFAPSRISSVKGWLKRLCKNAAIDELRKHPKIDGDAEAWLTSAHSLPEMDAMNDDQSNSLKQAMEALPVALKEIVELYYFHQRSQKTIAKQLGVSLRSVEAKLSQAKSQMRMALQGKISS